MLFEAFGKTYLAASMAEANREFLWECEEYAYSYDGTWANVGGRYVWITGNYFD